MFNPIHTFFAMVDIGNVRKSGFIIIDALMALAILIFTTGLLVSYYAERVALAHVVQRQVLLLRNGKLFFEKGNVHGSVHKNSCLWSVTSYAMPCAVKGLAGATGDVPSFRWVRLSCEWPNLYKQSHVSLIGGYEERTQR